MTTPPDQRALVLGEALIDVVTRPDGTRSEHPGGSPANVALGLGRLGRRVDLLTWLGNDAYGDLVRRHLRGSGVNVLVGNRSALHTPVAAAHIDEAGVASYEFDLEWDLPETWDEEPGDPLVIHTGSIATVLQPGGAAVAAIVGRRHESSTITYDPNLRPVLMGSREHALPVVDGLVRQADVVKVSDEDLAWLHPGVAPAEIAEEWSRSGPSLVVVTHGGEGAFASTSAGARISVEAPKVHVADTVGAGDSFMGGLIDGLWSAGLLGADRRQALADADPATVQAVLERCARIAAITVSRAGANPPRLSELG
ncbi:carbohydrate kinase family protein [Cellulomonas fengjieae]|uniref:carbohydrate kinase family protein n=1 Tax=Cellulomonas fengjieae TaxID=2819978 RepID=UPI001AAFF1C9|nr:carbohydrate kinase [Cellulomonas fengjieae]MBO3100480.1 carbohydrate kinase [Cellulomonas fengjieae]